jgi:hypothetical protein
LISGEKMITWFTSIFLRTSECGNEEEIGYGEYETALVVALIDRFSGFAGVVVEDADGNPLDPEDLPDPNTPDGGLDCIITIYPDEYTEQGLKWVRTRVQNIMDNGDF